jgi:hypothetical protein
VDVYWKENREFYRGTVVGFLKSTGRHQVLYDDGDTLPENLAVREHVWLVLSAPLMKRGFKRALAKRTFSSYHHEYFLSHQTKEL